METLSLRVKARGVAVPVTWYSKSPGHRLCDQLLLSYTLHSLRVVDLTFRTQYPSPQNGVSIMNLC